MEYLEFKDSQYSFGSKVINTALTAGSLMGFSPAKKMLKRRATKFAMNKASSGAAGVIGAKIGVDKDSVKQLIDGAGSMTGVTSGMKAGLNKGWGETKLGQGFQNSSDKFRGKLDQMKERLNLQRSNSSGPIDSSTNG